MYKCCKNTYAFTLVELIVVITILAVLSTIAFISLQGYASNSRDSVRLADMNNISKGMNIKIVKAEKLPIPDDKIDITASGTLLNYQGYAGQQTLGNIEVHGGGVDPLDNSYYTYSTNVARNKFQLLGYLENQSEISFTQNTYADLNDRFPRVKGSELGILVDSVSQKPIQGSGSNLDIFNTINQYIVFLNNTSITGTGSQIKKQLGPLINDKENCLTLLNNGYSYGNGMYNISPLGEETNNVYCDMTSDGGGWTRVGNNHLSNGDFNNGIGVLSESGSNPINNIVQIQSPILSGYALHQTGNFSTEYEVHFDDLSLVKEGYEIRISAWVSDSTGGIMHNRIHYVDGTTKGTGVVLGDLIDSQTVGGKNWELREYRTIIDKDPSEFNWYIGYGAEPDGVKDLYFTGLRLELFYR